MRLRTAFGAVAVAAALTMTTGVASAGSQYALLTGETDVGTAPLRWNPCQPEITYKVNTALAREKGHTKAEARVRARSEIIKAMSRLEAATGMDFAYTGKTTVIPTGGDWWEEQSAQSEIVIAYTDQDNPENRSSLMTGGAWGEGGQVYMYEGARLVVGRGFAVFNRDKAVKMRTGFGSGVHRGNLVLHELGHVAGLDHVSSSSQLINPSISDRSPNGYAAGDLAGLKRVGAGAGCIKGAAEFWPGS